MDRQGGTIQGLVADAIRDAAELASQEFALFRTEMADNVAGLAKGLVMFLAAAVFAVASLIWLTQALVDGIDVFLQRKWLSALIVGGLLLVVATVLVITGKNMLSAASLRPSKTVRSLKRDTDVLSEKVS